MKPKRPSLFSVPTEAISRNLTCSGLGLGLGAAAGVRPSPMGPCSRTALSVSRVSRESCEYQVRELTASLSSSTAAFIATVLSEIVFPENELAHSCIGPKMRSMLPFFSIALLRVPSRWRSPPSSRQWPNSRVRAQCAAHSASTPAAASRASAQPRHSGRTRPGAQRRRMPQRRGATAARSAARN